MVEAEKKPVPTPDAVTQGFWDSLKVKRTLAIQHCGGCDRYQHFPEPACTACGLSSTLHYRPVSGKGEVYSFVVTHQTRIRGLAGDVPYVIAWIELVEQKGLRLVSNIINCDPGAVRVGMPVKLALEERDGWVLPQFEPAR